MGNEHQKRQDAEILALHREGKSITDLVNDHYDFFYDAFTEKAARRSVMQAIKRARRLEKRQKKEGTCGASIKEKKGKTN